ncbi:MAG: hypothetical protein IKM02_06940, partial [Clostridia bacterium]|nr:hypothetical protein [Clostridia bacterium]
MKKMRIAFAAAMLMLIFAASALAAGTLTAGIDGNRLKVSWKVECDGDAVLSVYRNNWPVEIRNVNCADGGAEIWIDRPSGTYSIRMRTDEEYLTAGMTIAGNTPKPEENLNPTPTPVVTAHPTAEPAPTVTIGIFTPSPNTTKRPATVTGS